MVLSISICFVVLLTWYTYRTEYSEGYTSSEFRNIKNGDSVYIVFEKLGYPFYYSVTKNDNEGYNEGILTDSTDIFKLTNWISSDSNVVITLQYSRPKYPDAQASHNNGSFTYRGFKIHNGTIVEKPKFNYFD